MAANSEMQIRRLPRQPGQRSTTTPSLSSSGLQSSNDQILYSEAAVRYNENSLEQCRTSVSVLSGCVSGIIGITSYKGFLFYGFSMFLLSVIIYLFVRHEHKKLFTSLNHIFINGFFNGLLTYLLFWTFLYGIVHVY